MIFGGLFTSKPSAERTIDNFRLLHISVLDEMFRRIVFQHAQLFPFVEGL